MNISHVQHPVFRIFLKFLGNCALGRPNNHLTRSSDVTALGQFLVPNTIRNHFIPRQIWGHLMQTTTTTTPIVCGGLITHLATRFGYVPGPTPETCFLNLDFLRHAKDIVYDHNEGEWEIYRWMIYPRGPRDPIYIPSPVMHMPGSRAAHYCIAGAIPAHYLGGMEPEEDIPGGHDDIPGEPEDLPHPPTPPPYAPQDYGSRMDRLHDGQQEILDTLRQLSLGYSSIDNRLQTLDTRVGRLEADHRAAVEEQRDTMRPMYAYFDHMGYFNYPGAPQHPAWYDPSAWGNYGGGPSDQGGDAGDDY